MSLRLKRLLRLSLLLLIALPVAALSAQSDCQPNMRCGRVPWRLPVLPLLVSPTPFATSVPQINATPLPTNQSAYVIMLTPESCDIPPPVLGSDYKQTVVNSGPAAYWPLDETAGAAATDATGGGRHGTISGATLDSYVLAGGPAPRFDGVNDRVFISGLNGQMNGPQFTVALWMRVATGWSGSGMLAWFGETGNVFALARSGSSIVLQSGASAASAVASSNGTNWVHVAAVINRAAGGGQSARLYVNGANVASANTAPDYFTEGNALFLGSSGIGSYFAGGIGHAAVWTRALSPAEISTLANSSPAGVPTRTPDPHCVPTGTLGSTIDVAALSDTLALLDGVPGQVGIPNPAAGVDLYSGTATFFSYVLGIQAVNLGFLTPLVTFGFWSFFTFVGIKAAFIFLPILAALIGVIRRVVQLVLDFLPF